MEQCLVCLNSNADIFSRINTLSSEWKEGNIQRIIEKHLWWWYIRPPIKDNLQWICRQCWQEISTFHNFYLTVENVHKHQPILTILEGTKIDDENQDTTVKIEGGETVNGLFLAEDLMPLKRRTKGRKEIEEFMMVEVKSEENLTLSGNNEEVKDEVETTKCEINPVTIDSLDSACEPFLNNDFHDSDNNKDDDDYHVSDSDSSDTEDEDKIAIPPIQNIKIKRKPRTKKVDKPAVNKAKKPKKVVKKDMPSNKLTGIIKENDDFLTESQHKLECNICNAHLLDFRVLKIHYRNEHNILGYAVCCGRKFYKRGLLVDHVHVHKDPGYFKCKPCNKDFATRRGLEIHVESHKSRERKYKCEECGKSFFKPDIFERHKLMHVPENEKNFQCTQCEKKFASDYLRRQHEDITHNKKYFKICDMCGKSFRDNYSFLRHVDEHNGAPQTWETCEICGKKLTNKYGLKQHIKMRHTAENLQEQICPFCSRVSPNINAHKLHIKYTHTMERKHACHLCDKSFRRPLELREHLSTHTGEALYTCPHCPRTFISNANMHKHRKIAHRVEWEESRLKKLNESRKRVEMTNHMLQSLNNSVATIQSCPENLMMAAPSVSGLNTNVMNF